MFAQTQNDLWVSNNYHEVSIDATDLNFRDFQFLKQELKDKNIVAIGEQTHEDGSSFEGRSRLIEFLISEMGYEVILFEAGIFDIGYGADLYDKTKNISAFTNSLYGFWRNAAQNQNLFTFVDSLKSAGKEISFDGFDCKITSKYRSNYVQFLDSIVNIYDANIKQNETYTEYLKIWQSTVDAKGLKSVMPKISKKNLIKFKQGDELVLKTLKGKNDFIAQMVKNNDACILLYANHSLFSFIFNKKELQRINDERDVLMAENLNYLLENVYKNKKIILFGATYHFIRNNSTIIEVDKLPIPISTSIIMGNLMAEKYGKSIYTIGFTAYGGSYGRVKDNKKGLPFENAVEGSLEKILVDNNAENGILLLNSSETKPEWFHKNLTIRLFTYNSSTACKDWSCVLDAVFFIKEMKPISDVSNK